METWSSRHHLWNLNLRIMPPLNITRELVDTGLEIIEDVVKEVEKEK
jgi:4-aminobutyrate aminotransferase-like enzyme